jgi:DNA-binding MarR family transcriptional regulator
MRVEWPSMPGQAATTELAHELRETIGRLLRRLRAEPGELPVGQIAVLSRLDREGPASISDLAAADRMRPQSMAQTVHDLQHAGLVSRRPDPADGRRSFVELTPLGLETLNAMRAHREDWLTQALDRELDAEQRELLRRAVALLGRVADA